MSHPNITFNYQTELENYVQYLRKLIRENRVHSKENLETFLVSIFAEFIQKEYELNYSTDSSEDETKKNCEYCDDVKGCSNCEYFGFPCLNCAEYCYHFRLGPGHGQENRK